MTNENPSAALRYQLDHVVVAAASLEEGVAWCQSTLGVTPGPGGEHPLFGTHNRLLSIASPSFPSSYLEVIAINPEAKPTRPGPRWFDLDDPALRATLRSNGPQLIHWVVRTSDLKAAVEQWRGFGVDRGDIVAASRDTPEGVLEWQITVRPDGQCLGHGLWPTLIRWRGSHPTKAMPDSGVSLRGLGLRSPDNQVASRLNGVGLRGLRGAAGAWNLSVDLVTPRGLVTLDSQGV